MSVRTLACSAVAAVIGLAAPLARADFTLVSQDLSFNRQAQSLQASLTFNQAPNFYAIAADGNPVNSFQVEFDGAYNPSTTYADGNSLTAVIRGDEIHLANAIRVRAPTGDGGPGSGGWGPVVGTVPFKLAGDTITFAVPAADLGWTGGAWAATTYSLADGALTAQQSVTSVPAPPAFWAGLAGLVVVAAWQWRAAIQRRRSLA